jgi:diguanylate cyclase (GGDEF)-like protein
VAGVLTLYHSAKDAFTRDHLRILLAVSSRVGPTIENALKYQHVESSAATDYLTGLPNARAMFLHLDAEIARARREGLPLAVVMCDLDGFKQVNDRFGHLEGNKILRLVASGLREACREYDYVARMGGDEFVLLLPGVNQEQAQARIEQLREIADRAGIQVCGENLLSLSAGVAVHPADGADSEQLLGEADRRMYENKRDRKQGLTVGGRFDPRDLVSLASISGVTRPRRSLSAPGKLQYYQKF